MFSTIDKTPWPLVWLASYPKSGNTWFRVFLANYLHQGDQPLLINDLKHATPIAGARNLLDQCYGIDSTDLDHAEIDERRPSLYATWEQEADFGFHKVHDAYTYLPDGRPLLGPPERQAALYFIRNPLDVVVSFTHHNGTGDFDKTIAQMNQNFAMSGATNGFVKQLRQQLLTWSQHVLSWQQAPLPKHVVRYEDMREHPFETFRQAILFLQLPDDAARIEKAIRFSDFSVLQEQEQNAGFQEKAPFAKNFFRCGKIGSYRHVLNEEQVQRILIAHGEVMQQFGYDQ